MVVVGPERGSCTLRAIAPAAVVVGIPQGHVRSASLRCRFHETIFTVPSISPARIGCQIPIRVIGPYFCGFGNLMIDRRLLGGIALQFHGRGRALSGCAGLAGFHPQPAEVALVADVLIGRVGGHSRCHRPACPYQKVEGSRVGDFRILRDRQYFPVWSISP